MKKRKLKKISLLVSLQKNNILYIHEKKSKNVMKKCYTF